MHAGDFGYGWYRTIYRYERLVHEKRPGFHTCVLHHKYGDYERSVRITRADFAGQRYWQRELTPHNFIFDNFSTDTMLLWERVSFVLLFFFMNIHLSLHPCFNRFLWCWSATSAIWKTSAWCPENKAWCSRNNGAANRSTKHQPGKRLTWMKCFMTLSDRLIDRCQPGIRAKRSSSVLSFDTIGDLPPNSRLFYKVLS